MFCIGFSSLSPIEMQLSCVRIAKLLLKTQWADTQVAKRSNLRPLVGVGASRGSAHIHCLRRGFVGVASCQVTASGLYLILPLGDSDSELRSLGLGSGSGFRLDWIGLFVCLFVQASFQL